MTLIAIILGTLAAGIGSVWLAAALSFGVLAKYTQHMLSLAAGALLATAFMHLLPEAFESQAGAQELFAALLAGLVRIQGLAEVNAGIGIAAFAAVVVLTMLAALSFDPRLTWDAPAQPPVATPHNPPRHNPPHEPT